MSEYQYYEFLALDRPLNATEKAYIESLSSRVELTSTQAKFVYNYGDFRGNPQALVNADVFAAYCLEDKITVSTTKNSVILDINIHDEEMSHWIDSGEGYLSEMVSLRNDLLQGDLRSLYLAWLKAAPIYFEPELEDYIEPPVPANLDDLPNSLLVLVNFLEIDQDLIAAGAIASESQQQEEESLEDLIPNLSDREKNDFLVRLLKGESHLGVQLNYRLRELSGRKEVHVNNDTKRRTLSQLLKLAQEETIQRQKKEQEVARQAKVQKLESLAECTSKSAKIRITGRVQR